MILITGASGKTGKAVLHALNAAGQTVRVLVRKESHAVELKALGAAEAVFGDISDSESLTKAYSGIRTVYHICPNMHPDEIDIGNKAIAAAANAGLQHFIYHSVLHPQVREMQHHWNKLIVEAQLFKSGLNYTIVQPASYMQNIAGYWPKMLQDGEYIVPYDIHARFSMVDLSDIGQAAAQIILEGEKHYRAIYEMCGEQLLSSADVAENVSKVIHRPVRAVELPREDWDRSARANGMSDYSRTTLLGMFEYYSLHGFAGSSTVLSLLLGRRPATFEEHLVRFSQSLSSN